MPLNIMGTNAIQNVGIAINGKGNAVSLGDPFFPDIAALLVTRWPSIFLAHNEGWRGLALKSGGLVLLSA
jgi:hypothetical protein